MDPTTTFCPNVACSARGQTGQGNIGIHSCKDKRFICTECHKVRDHRVATRGRRRSERLASRTLRAFSSGLDLLSPLYIVHQSDLVVCRMEM